MTLFLSLAPFGTFASLMMLSGVQVALAASAVVALAVFSWDAIRGRSLKILTGGAFVVFAALFAHHELAEQALSPTQVRIALDSGMLALALASLALRFPFTLQYAREAVEPETLQQPTFIRVNYILTAVWIGAMTLMLIADIVSIYIPSTPLWTGAAIAFAARNGAGLFTQWYPKRVRASAEEAALKPA